MTNSQETVFACNPAALDKEQRARYAVLTKELIAGKQATEELPNGFQFRYQANSQNIRDVAEFVAYERLCCPFFDFQIAVEQNGDLRLRLTGAEGVKEFIRAEFKI